MVTKGNSVALPAKFSVGEIIVMPDSTSHNSLFGIRAILHSILWAGSPPVPGPNKTKRAFPLKESNVFQGRFSILTSSMFSQPFVSSVPLDYLLAVA